jgi:hypothetical protein
MLESEIVYHRCQNDEQPDLHHDIQADLKTMNVFWFIRHGYSFHLRD